MPIESPSGPRDHADRLSRRHLLARGAGLVGASALGGPLAGASRVLGSRSDEPKAKAVIQIFLEGGLSHVDTFDPKPDAPPDVRGAFYSIKTKLDDVRFTRLCPQMASVADKLCVVRSMTHTEAAHERGMANMMTGYQPSPAIIYPSFGAVVSHELGVRNDLPPYVCVPGQTRQEMGTGYLSAAYGPFGLGSEPASSNYEVKDLVPPKGIDDERMKRRRALLSELDGGFDGRADAIDAAGTFYEQAWKLIESKPAREAFRIDREPGKLRDAYGRDTMGQRMLLARRLVEAGVRFVHVVNGGWDMHNRIDRSLTSKMPSVDRSVAALIRDLDERGMLDSTLVMLTTEFGRTPRLNADRGRDHWPRVFSVVVAGGGLRRGHVHGSSDPSGADPAESPVSPADLAATMYHQLGIDHEKRLMSPGDRPIDIVRGGKVLRDILA